MFASRTLAATPVNPIGLGCMNLSHAYGQPPSAEQAQALLHAALDAGVTVFDTAALYGFGGNERLIGPVLAPHRDRITLCSKGGMAGVAGDDGVVRADFAVIPGFRVEGKVSICYRLTERGAAVRNGLAD